MSDLITRILDSLPVKLRSELMERVHIKVAGVSADLAHLLAVWDIVDNPTRSDALEEIQDRLADICTIVRGRDMYTDDKGKNGDEAPC